MFKTVSVIGGDLRQLTLAKMLIASGYNVIIYGFERDITTDDIPVTYDLKEALYRDIIILPVPVTFDNLTINMPYSDKTLSVEKLVREINPLSIVLGGCFNKSLSDKLVSMRIKHSDYMLRDELAIRNAVPTAEGAIEIAISETPITIHGSRCLVLGYGKVGKVLAKSLDGMGAITYVEARKYADLALIESHGYIPLSLNEAKQRLGDFDIIFNTIPAMILSKNELEHIKKNTLVIDLASKPGGVDFDYAKEAGIKVIWALSLPGRVAPVTSGIIIKDTILNILNEMEV